MCLKPAAAPPVKSAFLVVVVMVVARRPVVRSRPAWPASMPLAGPLVASRSASRAAPGGAQPRAAQLPGCRSAGRFRPASAPGARLRAVPGGLDTRPVPARHPSSPRLDPPAARFRPPAGHPAAAVRPRQRLAGPLRPLSAARHGRTGAQHPFSVPARTPIGARPARLGVARSFGSPLRCSSGAGQHSLAGSRPIPATPAWPPPPARRQPASRRAPASGSRPPTGGAPRSVPARPAVRADPPTLTPTRFPGLWGSNKNRRGRGWRMGVRREGRRVPRQVELNLAGGAIRTTATGAAETLIRVTADAREPCGARYSQASG